MNFVGKWIRLDIIIQNELSQALKDMNVCTDVQMNNNHNVHDIHITFLGSEECKQEGRLRGQKNDSEVKSTDFSSEGPEFKSQHTYGGSQAIVMRSTIVFWCV